MEYIAIILRMIFFYIFIIFIYRIMGKREVGQLGIVDLIVSILIAELVAICIENPKESIMSSIIPIITLVFLQIILSYSSLKNPKLRTVLDGSPSFIIKNGKVNYNEMIRQKYNLDDLLTQLREKGYRNIEDVEYAILENNGTLSIFSYQDKTKTPLPLPLILDGKIQYETLKEMHKEKSFVDNLLKKKKLNLEDIFYAFYKDTSIFVIKYRDLD
ncbi:MAG: DUF421 domain-containing protein [bacterium]|nr:DUF421 domain-containing protein [bacterium]